MEPVYWILIIWLLVFAVVLPRKWQKTVAVAHHIRKKREEIAAMEMLAKQFIGKECIIYTITSNDGSVQGTIKEVSADGMLIEDPFGQIQAINLEYVTRIREYPRNKKGKKKAFVLD